MRVLFLGEEDLYGSGRYLAAILRWSKIPFDHRADQSPIPRAWQRRTYDLFILSDYRASSFDPSTVRWLTHEIQEKGTGLLMIGGWASFTGLVGHYAGHPLEDLLPVRCIPNDDRVNRSALLRGIVSSKPIIVCGYHRTRAKPGTKTVLQFREVSGSQEKLTLGKKYPALVLGRAGKGATAAFLTDCAPHWAGGLIDWGTRRIIVSVKSGVSVEVGNQYLSFFKSLIHQLRRGRAS
jgi:uncharacterized membrane protein